METSFCAKGAEFFRVFDPEFSSKLLQIPPAFVRKYLPELQQTAILREQNGTFWYFSLVFIEKNLYFGANWENFVAQHSLGFGDFLLFKLLGDLTFSVTIFAKNGCKKESVEANIPKIPKISVKIKEEEQEQEHINYTASSQAYKETRIKKRGSNGSTNKSGTSKENQHNTREAAVTNRRRQKNPHFVASITDSITSTKYGVYIPCSVVKEVKLSPEMVLMNENNKKWPVKIAFRKDGRASITIGWSEFRKQNNLKTNDKCVFELVVVGKENKCKEIKVKSSQTTT